MGKIGKNGRGLQRRSTTPLLGERSTVVVATPDPRRTAPFSDCSKDPTVAAAHRAPYQ